jgi:HK97 gp10 family phage protein
VSRIEVQGLERVIRSFEKEGKNIRKKVEYIVSANALEGRNEAVKKAPKAFGKLAQSIAVEKLSPLEQRVIANMDYAPYVEFGTGGKVSVPAEWQSLAMSFKGQKFNFADQLERLKMWCRLKGIDEKAAYPILISILEEGIEPQPFMYPAWQIVKKNFSKDMINLMRNA